MKVLFDINIILDVLLNREKFVELSACLMSLVEDKALEGYLCATTLTTIDYLVCKSNNKESAKQVLNKLLTLFNIAEVNKKVLKYALNSPFKDFEDAVQYYSGVNVGINCIVTRNVKDYKESKTIIYTPIELLSVINPK